MQDYGHPCDFGVMLYFSFCQNILVAILRACLNMTLAIGYKIQTLTYLVI